MAYYVIYGADQIYEGRGGRHKYELIEANLYKEAEEAASELSRDVIESFQSIINDLEDELADWCDQAAVRYPDGGDAIVDMRDELYSEDVLYEVWEVNPTNKSFKELKEIFDKDPLEFIDNYCEN